MKRVEHTWGPWTERYNIFGQAMGYAERRCLDAEGCGYESERIPTRHEWLNMTRKELRARR